jgi:hypothetical protein
MDAKGGAEGGGATVTCQKCKTALATYESAPCGCSKFCVDCARKLATGGKCKVRGTHGCIALPFSAHTAMSKWRLRTPSLLASAPVVFLFVHKI